jgi:hypothetical protein
MAARLAGLVVLLVSSAAVRASGGAPAVPRVADADELTTSMACVEAWGEVRYRSGYDHIVHVRNGCEKPVLCAVSTNVNPDPQKVTVPPKEEIEVLTFRGSPAREFVPKVDCKLLM